MAPRQCGKALLDAFLRCEERMRRGRVGMHIYVGDRWYRMDEMDVFIKVGTASPYHHP